MEKCTLEADRLLVTKAVFNNVSMSKTEILDELPKLTKIERQEIRLRLAELDSEDWLDDEDPLTIHERALLEARLAAYAKDPEAGSTWEEVEGRIRARLSRQPNG
jgi:putative addiction module component (TIGR02574 family)